MDNKYDVFISYSSQDQKVVEGICGFLEREGYRCFVAYRDIPRGVVWASAITEALDASKMMVVVFSSEFNMSKQTDREIEIASENNMPILTYRVVDAKMTGAKKYYLKNLNWIDAFPHPENSFGRLLDSVMRLIGPSKIVADKAALEEVERLSKEETERKARDAAERERLEREQKTEEAKRKAEQDRRELERAVVQREADQEKANQLKISDDPRPMLRKKIWIALGAVAALVLLLVLLWLKKDSTIGSANGHEYVDLGLPSGTLWATCNVGASKPEGYGNYYAWGETSPKSTYNWDTYRYANGNINKLTKYCNKSGYCNNGFIHNVITLESIDDPAAANWGGAWQTPSKAQWDELLANTTNQWTTKNCVVGRLFTSKKNGQSFFLPAAGCRWDSDSGRVGIGSCGRYWSRSLYTDFPYRAWGLYFYNAAGYVSNGDRNYGFSVRPVRKN